MIKAEELKLLEKIEELIKSAGADSYIHDTFAGIVDICRNNIVNDFGDHPVKDLEIARRKIDDNGKNILKLEHENNALVCRLDNCGAEIEKLGHLLDSKTAECEKLKEERDCMSDCVNGSNELIDQAEAEIRKLKAEIVRMRLERMTDAEYANLYDTMSEED